MKKAIMTVVAGALLAACQPMIDKQGYVDPSPELSRITPGSTSREEVQAMMGSPSVKSSFGDEVWYYIHSERRAYAFFAPKVTEEKAVAIHFDPTGTVSEVKEYDKNDMRKMDYVSRTTPTEGHSLGIVEQLLGNVGRFDQSNAPMKNQAKK